MRSVSTRRLSRGRVVGLVALALSLPAIPSFAQSFGRPVAPDTILPRTAADSLPAYLFSLPHIPPAGVVVRDGIKVLLAAAPSASILDTSASRLTMRRLCPASRVSENAPDGYIESSVALDPSRYFVVVAMTDLGAASECENAWNASNQSAWRGLLFSDSTQSMFRSPEAMQVQIDGVALTPVASVARPAFQWRGGHWGRAGAHLRYYFEMASLAPRADGHPLEVKVRVWSDNGPPQVFSPDARMLQALSAEYLVWRLATTQRSDVGTAAYRPRRPVDELLRPALDESAGGRLITGALRAAAWSASTDAKRESSSWAIAQLLIADALFRDGDSVPAAALIAEASSAHRCLVPPSGVSATVARAVSDVREGRACATVNSRRALFMGLIAPGAGHYVIGQRSAGKVVAVATGATLIASIAANHEANQRYARYQGATTIAQATTAFQSAVSLRGQARTLAIASASIWVSDAVVGFFLAHLHNTEIDRDRL